MKKLMTLLAALALPLSAFSQQYKLVWSDEFDYEGTPDETKWDFENGFERNLELQWYQKENARCENGLLVIEARQEHKPNPRYKPGSTNWKESREFIECTSSSLKTSGRMDMLYGRLEVRARIPVGKGSWPAIWLLGTGLPWPDCGEIDVMEFYRWQGTSSILANLCWRSPDPSEHSWITRAYPLTEWTDSYPEWPTEFHVWRMDWDEDFIRIYLDDRLLNETDLSGTVNRSGRFQGLNPFTKPHYLLINLAIGGTGGRETKPEAFPLRYEIDYVRIYSKQ